MAVRRRVHTLFDVGEMVLDVFFELGRERCIARRHGIVRGALEDGQVVSFGSDHGDGLNAGRAGTDLADALAGEIDAFVRPLAGVVPVALEVIAAGNVRHIGGREAADGGDQIFRREAPTVLRRDMPAVGSVVVVAARNGGVEADITFEIELVGNEVEVAADFGMAGIALGPLPFLYDFFVERVPVGVAFAVAAGARVAVPVPGAADTAGPVDDNRAKPQTVAQTMELIKS